MGASTPHGIPGGRQVIPKYLATRDSIVPP